MRFPRRPAPLFANSFQKGVAPKKIAFIFACFVGLAAAVGVGLHLAQQSGAAELDAKYWIRDRLVIKYCRNWKPCDIPDIQEAGWELGSASSTGVRAWSVPLAAPRALAAATFPDEDWTLTGTTQFHVEGLYHGVDPTQPHINHPRSLTRSKPLVDEIRLSPAGASWRLDWAESHWTSEPIDNLRLEVELCLLPGRTVRLEEEQRAARLRLRLEAERGSVDALVKLLPRLVAEHPNAIPEIKAEAEIQSKNPAVDDEFRRLIAAEAAKL